MTRKPKKPEKLAQDLIDLVPEMMKGFQLEALYVPSDVAAYFTITDLYLEGRHYRIIPKEVVEGYLESVGMGKSKA